MSEKNNTIHQELRRGLILALKRIAEIDGITIDFDKFLTTRFINAGDGPSLEFSLGLDLKKIMADKKRLFQVGQPERLDEEAFAAVTDHMAASHQSVLFDTKDALTEIIERMPYKTFKYQFGTLARSKKDIAAKISEQRLAPPTQHHEAFVAKSLDDLVGGFNSLLTQLDTPKENLIQIELRR